MERNVLEVLGTIYIVPGMKPRVLCSGPLNQFQLHASSLIDVSL